MIGSPLLGAFVAGMCFTDVPLSHLIWQQQMKRILKWMVRIFFAATVAFAIPVDKMMNGESLMRGLVIGLVPGILMKLVSGVAAAMPYKDAEARRLAAAASPATCGGKVQPLQFLVGTAMIARGEFAFLVALQASKLKRADDTYMLREEVYASVTWALMCALISAPFLFKWSLRMYTRAVPVLRGDLIGGSTHSGEDFVIKLTGKHHTGAVTDTLQPHPRPPRALLRATPHAPSPSSRARGTCAAVQASCTMCSTRCTRAGSILSRRARSLRSATPRMRSTPTATSSSCARAASKRTSTTRSCKRSSTT
jgi:hypothetical protein